jgi:microcystin-dependent protein
MDPFIGQIQPFGFNFPPRGWAKCDGQLLAISSYTALFSLLGTTFGGDGRTTFGLPDLRGRSMVHIGAGPGLDTISWGEKGGKINESLTVQNMPSHDHTLINGTANVKVGTTAGTATSEADSGSNGLIDGGATDLFSENPTTANFIGAVEISGKTSLTGGSLPFNIRNPFLGIEICIALNGIFPSRN